ncbi:MAG TPA: hypothetical protein VGM02_05710 [Acidobacteriaceae bacterium]|jgi:hypothetical protein
MPRAGGRLGVSIRAQRFPPFAHIAALCLALATPCMASSDPPDLPDAPQANAAASTSTSKPSTNARRDNVVFGVHVGLGYPAEAGKYDIIINPGERAQPLTAKDKMLYAAHEDIQLYTLTPALVSAGIGQITGGDPKFGTDAGGFGGRFGAGMLRGATDRLSGDGWLAVVFHQDPRFYREGEGHGTIMDRGLHAARQTILRRNDDGDERINASGILGHAVANCLALAYYPSVSQHASVAARGFGIAVAGDAGSKLFLEFGPDILRVAFRHNQ